MTRRSRVTILGTVLLALLAVWIYSITEFSKPPERDDVLEAEKRIRRYDSLRRQGKDKEAKKVLEEVIAIGAALAESGEPEKAQEVFAMVLVRDRGNAAVGRHMERLKTGSKVDKLLLEGLRLYDARDFAGARKVFEQVLRIRPDQPMALNYLGVMARDRGDTEQAIDYYNRAVQADPNTPANYYNLAGIYYQKKAWLAAEDQLVKAMRLGVKSSYYLLYALCGKERGIPEAELVGRLRKVVRVAAAQVHGLRASELTPRGALANDWTQATKLLLERGDDFGVRRLRKLAEEAKKPEVKTFAEELLKVLKLKVES